MKATTQRITSINVVIELSLDQAVDLQRTITSSRSAVVKDQVFDALTTLFREQHIPGGIYV